MVTGIPDGRTVILPFFHTSISIWLPGHEGSFSFLYYNTFQVRWVPVSTTWHILRLWMEEWPPAVNILNKQSRTNDKGWSFSLENGCGANNPSPSKINLLQKTKWSLGPGRILWINNPSNGIWI
jgi:hypothetical protein